jgi:hypothetical protein
VALRAEYEQRVAEEVHRDESDWQIAVRLRKSQAEVQAALNDHLRTLRAAGADKMAQQLGAERQRLRALLAAAGASAAALLS